MICPLAPDGRDRRFSATAGSPRDRRCRDRRVTIDLVTSGENALERTRANTRWAVAVWSAAAVFAWVAGGLESFTAAAEVAVLLPVLVLFGIAVFAPPPRKPAPRQVPLRGWLAWLVPILGFCGLEVVNGFIFGSVPAHPTWSILMDPVLEWHPARAGAVLIWIVAGWELVRR